MPQLGCAVLIALAFGFQYFIIYINKILHLLYATYTPVQMKEIGLFIALIVSIYFLRPVYQIISGKSKERATLKQLGVLLESNHYKAENHLTLHHDPMENLKPKPLPCIIQKIALITSENSAGHLDFKEILTCGTFELYPTSMNELYPHSLTTGIIKQIEEINHTNNVDVICITRGGGLAISDIFNTLELVSAIRNSQIPILLGTGHATDHSLCDKVSDSPVEYGKKRYFITPTALAHFLNEYNDLQIVKTDKRLIQLGSVTDEIKLSSLLVYAFILYLLYQTFLIK